MQSQPLGGRGRKIVSCSRLALAKLQIPSQPVACEMLADILSPKVYVHFLLYKHVTGTMHI